MKAKRAPMVGCWRALVDSPLLLATWMALALTCTAIFDLAGSLRRAEEVRGTTTSALARAAAETAALRQAANGGSDPAQAMRIGAVEVAVDRCDGEWRLTSTIAGRAFDFRAADLPGAAPAVFARPCSVVDPRLVGQSALGQRIGVDDLPRLDESALAAAARADRSMLLRRDGGVALLSWESGTERDDFVFDPRRAAVDPDSSSNIVVVPGHLWIEVAERPLRLVLQKDLVLVVRGNLYVGRSIEIEGRGRLVIAAANEPGCAVFADVDGNGRWSPGDVLRRDSEFSGPPEGTGNVYFGLPGSPSSLTVDASVVVGGEAHLAVDVLVNGPLVLPFGVTQPKRRENRLVAGGRWSFQVERENVPGFRPRGARRPGLLHSGARDLPPATQQGLYLSSPAR